MNLKTIKQPFQPVGFSKDVSHHSYNELPGFRPHKNTAQTHKTD